MHYAIFQLMRHDLTIQLEGNMTNLHGLGVDISNLFKREG